MIVLDCRPGALLAWSTFTGRMFATRLAHTMTPWHRAAMIDLVVRNGRVVTPAGVIQGGVGVAGETIVAVGADGTLPPARRTIDARQQYVLPGLIDAHVQMGSEEDASIAAGLEANMPVETEGALYGGVTTFGHFVGQRNEPLVPNVLTTIREGNRWSHVDYFMHAIVQHRVALRRAARRSIASASPPSSTSSTPTGLGQARASPGSVGRPTRGCSSARCASAPTPSIQAW